MRNGCRHSYYPHVMFLHIERWGHVGEGHCSSSPHGYPSGLRRRNSVQEEGRCRKTTSMSSDSGYSRTRDKGDEYGQGNRYTMTYTEQSTEKGMGIHPSIGCFSEKDQANPLHSKKPNVGATASKTYDGQSLATHSNHGTHQQDSASSDAGGIVNLRSPSSTEGKAKKPASKGKK